MARRLTVIVPLLLALAACAGGGGAPGTATVTAASVADPSARTVTQVTGAPQAGVQLPSPVLASSAAAAPAAPLATAAAGEGGPTGEAGPTVAGDATDEEPVAELPGLVLEAGGLGVITADTHITHLEFGTSAKRVRAVVARLVGPVATRRRSCGGEARTVSVVHGFTLVASGDRFVGWVDRGAGDRHLSTADGVAVGMTVAELRAGDTVVTLKRATGGATWTSGTDGLSGRATSTAATGRVTQVSSGEAC